MKIFVPQGCPLTSARRITYAGTANTWPRRDIRFSAVTDSLSKSFGFLVRVEVGTKAVRDESSHSAVTGAGVSEFDRIVSAERRLQSSSNMPMIQGLYNNSYILWTVYKQHSAYKECEISRNGLKSTSISHRDPA